MKKSLRAVRIVLLAIVIVVVAGVVVVRLFADRALKLGIERAGTKALNVGVSVDDVDLSIMGGRLGLRNLEVDNPPDYQHDKLLELRDGAVEVEVRSLLGDVVNIREIKLDGVSVVLEQRGISGNNLQDILRSISAKDKHEGQPSGKKLHIANLEVSDITVKVKVLPVPGKADTVTLKLKPIMMTDLGSDNKLDTARLTGKILVAIAEGVAEQGVGVLPKEIVGPLSGELKKLGKLSEALLGTGGGILKEGQDLGKEVTEGLKGLFEPKKKQE